MAQVKVGSDMTYVGSSGGGEGRSCSECVLETESTELDGFNVEC